MDMLGDFWWARGNGRELKSDKDAAFLAVYLRAKSNTIGLFHRPAALICHELDLTPERLEAAAEKLRALGEAELDLRADLAWVPDAAGVKLGGKPLSAGDKRRASIRRELDAAGAHPFRRKFLELWGPVLGVDLPAVPVQRGLFDAPPSSTSQAQAKPPRSPLEAPSKPPSEPDPAPDTLHTRASDLLSQEEIDPEIQEERSLPPPGVGVGTIGEQTTEPVIAAPPAAMPSPVGLQKRPDFRPPPSTRRPSTRRPTPRPAPPTDARATAAPPPQSAPSPTPAEMEAARSVYVVRDAALMAWLDTTSHPWIAKIRGSVQARGGFTAQQRAKVLEIRAEEDAAIAAEASDAAGAGSPGASPRARRPFERPPSLGRQPFPSDYFADDPPRSGQPDQEAA